MRTLRAGFRYAGLGLFLAAGPVAAAPIVDGTRDGSYGSILSIQTVQTSFGDNFSELDGAYGLIEAGKLYLMITGNLEGNFNRIEIFIDSFAGGQTIFDSSGNDGSGKMDGLKFDNGFTADYYIVARRGTDNGNPKFDLDFAYLIAQSASGYFDIMGGSTGTGATGTGVNGDPVLVGFNNSNVAGVTGGSEAANQLAALSVTTGLELAISLQDLNYTSGPIRVMVGINNANHDYWSNQFLGGLATPQGSLGGDGAGAFTGEGAIDFTTVAGNQYFVVPSPEPLTLEQAVSRRAHVGGGTVRYDVPLSAGGPITAVEPRQNGMDPEMVLTFSGSIEAVDGVMNCGDEVIVSAGACTSLVVSGAELTVNMTFQVNQCVWLQLSGIRTAGGGPALSGPTQVGVLTHQGNINGDANVNIADLNLLKNFLLLPVTADNFRNDVNCDRGITVSDLLQVKNNLLIPRPGCLE